MSFDITKHAIGAARTADVADPAAPAEKKKTPRKKSARPTPAEHREASPMAERETSLTSLAADLMVSLAEGETAIDLLRPSEWRTLIDGGVVECRDKFLLKTAVAVFGAEREARQELAALPPLSEARQALEAARREEEAVAAEVRKIELEDLSAFAGAASALADKVKAAGDARRDAQRVVSQINSLHEQLATLAPEPILNEVRRRRMADHPDGPRGRLLYLKDRRHSIMVAINAADPGSPLYNTDLKFANSLLDGFLDSEGWDDLVSRPQPGQSRVLKTREFRARVVKLSEQLPEIEAEIVEVEAAAVAAEAYIQEPMEAWIDSGVVPREYV